MMSDGELSETPRSGRLKKRSVLSRMAEQASSGASTPASSRASLRPPHAAKRLTPLDGDTKPPSLNDSFNNKFRNLSMLSAASLSGESDASTPSASLKRIHAGGSDESESEKPSSRKRPTSNDFPTLPPRSSDSPVEHVESSPEPLTSSRRLGRLERRAESSIGRSASSEVLSRFSSVSNPIPVSRARSQGFLVGAMSGTAGAMLGAEELDRVLPERQLRLYAVTWNIGCLKTTEYPTSLELLLYPETLEYVPDIYIIGIQEISPENSLLRSLPESRKEWALRIQATLGPNFVPYECTSMGTLHLSIFLRRDLIWFVSVPENASVSTRAAISTKGAVAISFMIFGTSILAINSHFKSDDGNFKARIDDYNKIVTSLSLPKQVLQNQRYRPSTSVTSRFDCVFWLGDLNFRIDRPRDIVERVLSSIRSGDHPNYEDLLCGDELLQARAEGTCFQEFDEGRINFAPTYKFDQLSDAYDTSGKMRIPSYTDRIMYRVRRKGSVSCIEYDSLPQMKFSDHRPVFGLFEIDVKPGQDNIPLAAGSFLRDLYMEGNRRRALRLDLEALKSDKPNSRVCVLQ